MHEHGAFGRWLKQRRTSLDLTQDELAARVGCAPETIRRPAAAGRRKRLPRVSPMPCTWPAQSAPSFCGSPAPRPSRFHHPSNRICRRASRRRTRGWSRQGRGSRRHC